MLATTRLLRTKEAAHRLGVSVSFLNKARVVGDGPEFIKLGRAVAYQEDDLAVWLHARKRRSTSDAVTPGR